MLGIFLVVIATRVVTKAAENNSTCTFRSLDEPIAVKKGDLVIGGMFQIGTLGTREENGTQVEYCSYEKVERWGLQKALALRRLIEEAQPRFYNEFNLTLGYEMYDTCGSSAVTMRVSARLVSNENVVGVSGVDKKSYIKRSASITASFHVPTFVYMYSDDELLNPSMYPTLFSVIDTEVVEAKITIRFLEKMGFRYMDIWYHSFSRDMAMYIYEKYVKKVGCGRITEVTSTEDLGKIQETYNKTGGTPSQVQLILSNSRKTTIQMLKEMINNLGFRDKIYVMGLSNGRKSFLESYKPVLDNNTGNSAMILPLPDLLNFKPENLTMFLQQNWTQNRDRMDTLYRMAQVRANCSETKPCSLTSWIPYVIGGTQLLLQSLYTTIKQGCTDIIDKCRVDFRTNTFKEIIKENRTVEVRLDGDETMHMKLFNKTLNTGYAIGVYQTRTGMYGTLGRVYYDHIHLTNEVLLKEISGYNKTCSPTCQPGTYRLFDESMQYVPCCWTCANCQINHYSTEVDTNACKSCHSSDTSTESRTGCVHEPDIYIRPTSHMFIIGAISSLVGVILVVTFGVVIFKNEDRPAIKASDPGYLYMILLSLLIGFPAGLIPLLKPSPGTCTAEYFTFTIFAVLISVNLLYKSVKVYGIFKAAKDFKPPKFGALLKRAGQTWINSITLAVTLVLLLIDCFTFTGSSWSYGREQPVLHQPSFLMCTSSNIWQLSLPMIIPAVSFLTTLVLAFKMRHFPHNFRESLNIFCATLIVLLCSVMFLGGYQLSPPYIRSFLRAVVLFVTAIAFLVCIFLPKIVILLMNDVDVEEERLKIRERVKKYSTATPATGGFKIAAIATQVTARQSKTNTPISSASTNTTNMRGVQIEQM